MIAILIWRNSFIFHDYDKIVSVFIHLLPSMLYYTLRWHSHSYELNSNNSCCFNSNCEPLTLFDYGVATLGYFLWQVLYIVKTEVLDKKKLDSHPELLTSLRWMSSDTKNSLAKNILKTLRRVGIFGPQEQFEATSMKTKMVFVFSQLLVTVAAFLPTPLFYYSSVCHMLFIIFIFTVTIFNGASFYIEVFSKRYNLKISRIEEMHRIAQEASKMAMEIDSLTAQIGHTVGDGGDVSAPSPKRLQQLQKPDNMATGKEEFATNSLCSQHGTPDTHSQSFGSHSEDNGGSHDLTSASPNTDGNGTTPGVTTRRQQGEEASLADISRDLHRTSDRAWAIAQDHAQDLQYLLSAGSRHNMTHPGYHNALPSGMQSQMEDGSTTRSYSLDETSSVGDNAEDRLRFNSYDSHAECDHARDSNCSADESRADALAAASGAVAANVLGSIIESQSEKTPVTQHSHSHTHDSDTILTEEGESASPPDGDLVGEVEGEGEDEDEDCLLTEGDQSEYQSPVPFDIPIDE
eukprot:gene30298-37490_t